MLSTEHYQRPANFVDAQAYMQDTLKNQFNWQDFILKEGAGLSRDNRLSAEQLVELLNKFRAWKHLLPEVTAGVYAKSGTLNKVSTLAGYTIDKQHHWNAFALMMKQSVPSKRRNIIIRIHSYLPATGLSYTRTRTSTVPMSA
jgi:D-alanyl-D-alanine carboxypeptidase/D-alanyl-D-alanine-endopeptidase (penicillin-binding protein 4)